MIPPENVKLYEHELATFWFDEEGIFCGNSKNVPRTFEKQKQNLELIKEIIGDKKVCFLADISNAQTPDNKTADYMAEEFPNLYKAIASITSSTQGTIFGRGFLKNYGQTIPMALFDDEAEAREWLKQYL